MGGAPVTSIDYSDIQGLVRFGYKRLTEATYALVRVKSAPAARTWLRAAPIATAQVQDPSPTAALQVAFTAAGLEMIGVPATVIASFSPEFLGGMTDPNRSRRLGDLGANDPSKWEWGIETQSPHLLIMFFAAPGGLEGCVKDLTGPAWDQAFEEIGWLYTADLDGVEPFGFTDGISQPAIDWEQARDTSAAVIDYTNLSALGEFLLGYRNEYGKYTDRPVIDSDAVSAQLPAAEDAPEKKDVGRNGTYLVVRQLRQDVRGFWQFVRQQAAGDPERGLHFICVNANICRQFEFLQNAWMTSSKFSGLTGETDPLVGGRSPIPGGPVTADFTIQQDGRPPARVSGLPQFVTVRGGAYFFLPGIRALRYFASVKE